MAPALVLFASAQPRPAAAAPPPQPPSPPTLRVGASALAAHATVSAALATITSDADPTTPVTILIEPGTYRERLVIPATSPPIKLLALLSPSDADGRPALAALVAAGKASGTKPGASPPFPTVTLTHTTASPYESTLDTAAPRCAAAGIRFAPHASPSVANNFGVLVREGGSLTLQSCVVASRTGSGLGVEGSAAADGCDFSGCASYGAAAFGAGLALSRCTIRGNKRGGVLARGVARLGVSGCVVSGNGGPGLDLAAGGEGDAPGTTLGAGCDLTGNVGGPARVGDGWAGGEVIGA